MTDESQKRQQRADPKRDPDMAQGSNMAKASRNWVTGDEPMTGTQVSYLKTLSEEAGEEFDANLSKAEASKRIDELKSRDPRLNRK
jgi:hypothetical protein